LLHQVQRDTAGHLFGIECSSLSLYRIASFKIDTICWIIIHFIIPGMGKKINSRKCVVYFKVLPLLKLIHISRYGTIVPAFVTCLLKRLASAQNEALLYRLGKNDMGESQDCCDNGNCVVLEMPHRKISCLFYIMTSKLEQNA